MNDLISRAEAIDVVRSLQVTLGGKQIFHPEAKKSVIGVLDDLATVDAEPVRHGWWIINKHYGDHECSECGKGDFTVLDFKKHNMKYCPNCGAKMDAEAEG